MTDLKSEDIIQVLLTSLQRYAFLDRLRAQYHLAVFPDDNSLRVEHYESLDDLVAALRKYVASADPPAVVPFMGAPMPITKPPHRQLRTPQGLIPLEVVNDYSEDDDFNWTLDQRSVPGMPEPPPAGNPTVLVDEDELDDDEDSGGEFEHRSPDEEELLASGDDEDDEDY